MQTSFKRHPCQYRCDVCGRRGFWRSDGFEWMRYGPLDGDGVDTCSNACRKSMGDPEKAFKRLLKRAAGRSCGDKEYVRKHDGLLSDKPPRPTTDEDFAYTTSTGETITCPRCAKPVRVYSSVCASCKAPLVFESETITTHYCTMKR